MGSDMDDDEIELKILEDYIAQYELAEVEDPGNKCAREIDMRQLLRGWTGREGRPLELQAELWLDRLAPESPSRKKGPLKRCTLQTHRLNARAFRDPFVDPPDPAWERFRQLDRVLHGHQEMKPPKELAQKFRILFSPAQAQSDFSDYIAGGVSIISIVYSDVDGFKQLNTRFLESVVDRTLLPDIQKILKRLTDFRGAAYHEGGDEFLILLPNQDSQTAFHFCDCLCNTFTATSFKINDQQVSVALSFGIASYPNDGSTFQELKEAANTAKKQAKASGGGTVCAYRQS
jgi:diguanylate cyclase (GGDEF)-like protein